MGIRDRHSDNVLVQRDGGLFQIDYGYVLGEELSGLDASKFAITGDLQTVMGTAGWDDFVRLSVSAFCALREHYTEILSFGRTALRFLEWSKVDAFLRQRLMVGADDVEVEQYIKDKIGKAPSKWKTRMKNTIHAIAMNVKK